MLAKIIRSRLNAVRAAARQGPSPPSEGRVPPGQRVVGNFPVLDLGERPRIDRQDWQLALSGAVAEPRTVDWAAIQALPRADQRCDIHCVTRWTRLDVPWQGVHLRDVMALAQPRAEASHVMLHGADGYTANLPVRELMADDALLAFGVDNGPLTREHGGPVRAVLPARYFWKSVKWLQAIVFHCEDRPGFWESRGYHNDGDPWREERYGGSR